MNSPKLSLSPLPLFDDLEHLEHLDLSALSALIDEPNPRLTPRLTKEQQHDFFQALSFLKSYKGSQGTFNAYRREVEKLLQWAWHVSEKTIKELRRNDIEQFVYFCQKPYKSWIGLKKVPRFIVHMGRRVPNSEWRPFVATLSKTAHRKGEKPTIKDFELTQSSMRGLFAILSSFYNYLLQEEYVLMNPVALIRQKSQFIRKQQGQPKIRRLSELQWDYVIKTVTQMAQDSPEQFERSLFILSSLYAMYLRISELTATSRWSPQMNHFYRDQEGRWWFTTVGKGNKERRIAVSQAMLEALRRWRRWLGLSPLPSPADKTPLLPKTRGKGPITSTHYIRDLVQRCFDEAINQLRKDNFEEEAEALIEATVHWLRHTGISDDVKIRPREHVRDDAGHSSSAITDKYIDIELKERHRSAQKKQIAVTTMLPVID